MNKSLYGKTMCAVYGSQRHDEMYIYMPKHASFDSLPEALRVRFGKPRKAMEILLSPEKSLARVTGEKILKAFLKQGFYLQLPPAEKENWLRELQLAQNDLSDSTVPDDQATPEA